MVLDGRRRPRKAGNGGDGGKGAEEEKVEDEEVEKNEGFVCFDHVASPEKGLTEGAKGKRARVALKLESEVEGEKIPLNVRWRGS